MTTLRQFIVTNFANIAIALSIVFLILELNQNRRMMARELVFMEAQAYQGRSELAFDLHSLTVENPDLAEMLNRYRAGKAYSEFSPIEQRRLKAYYISQLKVLENTFFQVRQGLISEDLWVNFAGSLKDFGTIWYELEISMDPMLEKEVNKILVSDRGSGFAD
ncbi:MAG: hypothetical protein VXX78_04305 [Pseudomonadota bacterium]|nr:hypothetical protein [Pseudomonadota bacterium]